MMNLNFGAKMAAIAAAIGGINPFGAGNESAAPIIKNTYYPTARPGRTGIPAARRRKFKQRGRAST